MIAEHAPTSGRAGRIATGFALHAAAYSLPLAANIIMLNRIVGTSFVDDGVGVVIFAVLFCVIAALFERWGMLRWGRLFPMGIGRIAFDHTLSAKEKLDTFRRDPTIASHLLAQTAMTALIALTMLAVRGA